MSSLLCEEYAVAARQKHDGSFETTGIAFSDYQRMQTRTHVGNLPVVPPFSQNDRQLQWVLLVRAWLYVHGRGGRFVNPKTIPETIDREAINHEATAKALRGYEISESAPAVQHAILEAHKAAVKRAGSFLAFQASVAYRAWRQNQSSVAVAESLGITPWCVRQHLSRLRRVAERLGYEVGPPGRTAGRTYKYRKGKHRTQRVDASD